MNLTVRALLIAAITLLCAEGARRSAPALSLHRPRDSCAAQSFASGLNDEGQVVGTSPYDTSGFTHAFLYSGWVMSDLGVAGINSGANSINDNGQIAGYYEPNGPQPARWVNGVMTDLGNLPGGVGGAAEAINKFGQIVGYANTSGSGAQHAFLYSNGSMSDLGTLGGVYVLSQANALNSQAAVVGASFTAGFQHNHGFLYANGHMTDLGTFPGGTDSEATGINDLGQIIGYSNSSTFNQHGFVITNGVMNDLGVLPGGNYAQPFGINNAGQIVGEANSTNVDDLAFLYQGGVMYELNQLLDGSAPGWVLGAAVAINDKGMDHRHRL